MGRGTILLTVAVLAISAAGRALSEQGSIEGVWRFQEEVDHREDGSVVATGSASGYDGILIFSRGYMSSTLVPKGRTWTLAAVSPAELRETFEESSAHAGRYEIDPAAGTIRIESIVSLDPSDEGQWATNHYSLQNDTLSISGAWTYHGEKLTFTVRLARVK